VKFGDSVFMINKALSFLEQQLSAKLNDPAGPKLIELISLVNDKGELNIQAGQLALTLVSVEEERILKTQPPREKHIGNNIQFANPDIKINLLIMIAANPGNNRDNYVAALEALSRAITFFQGTSSFGKLKFPALLPEIEKLTVELFTLTLEQQNQLWTSLGAKYVPSVLYKIRLIVFDADIFGDNNPAIRVIDNKLQKLN
jgi:Pvc16 N-terminal domain